MAGLIDTSVIVEAERLGRPATDIHTLAAGEPVAVASAVAAELLVGVERATPPERQRRRKRFVEEVLAAVPVIPFDLPAARVHDRLLARLLEAGQAIGAYHLMIAATAFAHGYDVFTLNVRDFERVPGLVVRRPDW